MRQGTNLPLQWHGHERHIQLIAVYAIPVIFTITLHEAAHGYVAHLVRRSRAQQAGRVTLNPIKHIDPVSTLLVPVVILLTSKLMGAGGLLFGWAKPVPVDFSRLRRPKRDMLWVVLVGSASNLFTAILRVLCFRVYRDISLDESFWYEMAQASISVNLVLVALNLLPILLLDGGRILFSLLCRTAWPGSIHASSPALSVRMERQLGQRVCWFKRGLNSTDARQCNTFGTSQLWLVSCT